MNKQILIFLLIIVLLTSINISKSYALANSPSKEDYSNLLESKSIKLLTSDFSCKKLTTDKDSTISCIPVSASKDTTIQIGENTFSNFKESGSPNKGMIFIIDKNGDLEKSDFLVNDKGSDYIFGNQKIYAPANSRIIYDKTNGIKIIPPKGAKLDKLSETMENIKPNSNFNYETFIVADNGEITLPSNDILNKGTLLLKDKQIFVPKSTSTTINGLLIKSKQDPVELRFGLGPYLGLTNEKGNFVRFINKEKIKTGGKNFDINLNPKSFFVKGLPNNIDAESVSLPQKGYYDIGDKGLGVEKIQALLDMPITGKYNQKTKEEVKTWQKLHSLATDGKFGKDSLGTVKKNEDARLTKMNVDGTILISQEDGKLKIDSDGNSIINTGSVEFVTLKESGKILKSIQMGMTLTPNFPTILSTKDTKGKELATITHENDGTTRTSSDSVLSGFSSLVGKSANYISTIIKLKKDTPVSADLLSRFISRSGEPVTLDLSEEWKSYIIQQIDMGKAKKITTNNGVSTYQLSAYGGPLDMKTSLGNFGVKVKSNDDGTKKYEIYDTYDFNSNSFIKKIGIRHCFEVEDKGYRLADKFSSIFIEDNLHSSGKFKEKLFYSKEFKTTIGKALCISEGSLNKIGVSYPITGSFNGLSHTTY